MQVLEHYGAALGADRPYQESIKKQILDESGNLTDVEVTKRATALAKPKSIAVAFLKRADRKRYGALWSELENNYTRGQDQYPVDITSAYNLLLNYKLPPLQARREQHNTAMKKKSAQCSFCKILPPCQAPTVSYTLR